MSENMSQARPDVPAGLVFFEAQEKPRQYVIFDRALIKGRQEMDIFTPSGLQLAYPFLDEEQCEIRFERGKWYYRNLSENVFTFVGGKLLPCGAEQELQDNMVIRLSNDRMLTAVFLRGFASSTDWQMINMDDGRHTVVIENEAWEEGNSALTLEYENSRWQLAEIGVTNLLLNGENVTGPAFLQFDDCLQIGSARFIFEGSGLLYGVHTRHGSLNISIDERTVRNAMKKYTLLKDIQLTIEPGNMVMILGGSGAGKSTFVNAVTGYEKAKATILEGNVDYYRQYDEVKHRIGFVPQENLMREEDTVLMTVSNAADLRLPATLSDEEKKRRVRMALETFGLSGREDTLVSKLSGGQKKRLSICTEFVASPNLFILDEPDSGLDGIMARGLMENLRLIACQGKIVLVITHAPDRVAHLFDKVIVLAKGSETQVGQLAFYGGIQEAKDFFETDSLENVVKRINAVNEGGEGRADEYIEKYKTYSAERDTKTRDDFREAGMEEEEGEEDTVITAKLRYAGRLGQIPIFLGKHIRMFITEGNWKVLPLSAIIAYLVVYVMGKRMFINMEGTSYAAFAITCVSLWNGVFNSIQVVCKERGIIKREHRAGLHISSYLASHMIYQAIICLIQVLMMIAIFLIFGVRIPSGSVVTGSFLLDLGITMFLITYASDMLGLMISCIVHTPMTAMTVMPFVLIVQLVFANFVIPLNAVGQKLSNVTVSKWGIQAICSVANYNSQESTVLLAALDMMNNKDPESLISKIQHVLSIEEVNHKVGQLTASQLQNSDYAFTSQNVLLNWGMLLAFTILYVIIGFIFLKQVDRDKR